MKKELFKTIIIKFALINSTIYILWRMLYTLPLKFGVMSLIIGIIFFFIEFVDFFEFIIHYINVLKMKKEKEEKNIYNIFPDIDVLITTINEERSLLEKTIKSCKEMKYDDKSKIHIYLCDDGRRNDIQELAKEYKIEYITRDDNKDAKAGNLNNALKYLKSKYILTLDADMCPQPNFLIETIKFFSSNEKIGFVQTPQAFYNLDIFQNRYGVKNKIPFDQNFFYHYLQPAKSRFNATVYCGTNAIILREALNKIGGFATGTLTEDIATRNVN